MSSEQQPWYEDLVKALGDSQTRNAASHMLIATHFRTMADHYVAIAEQHERLAASVPDGDQAAADLGTATDRHDLNNLRTVVQGEQGLAKDLERQLATLARDIVELAGKVHTLAAAIPAAISAYPGRLAHEADERDHGHDEMGAP